MNNSNTTTSPNPFQMGTVNMGGTPDIKAFNQSMVTANSTIPTVTPVQPQTIPQSQNIATFGTQPINLPASNIPQPAPTINQADQILRQTAVADTEAQKMNQSISKSMLELIPQLQGQTQELATQQKAFGVQDLKQNLLNLNNQIIQKQAEIAKDDVTLANTLVATEGGGILGSIVARQQLDTQRKAQLVRSLKMADIGILNAQALAAQGNIALAQDAAKQAVETKYAPYKELLETLKMQSEALQPILTADEKKQAREQDIRTNLALKEVDKAQKNESESRQMFVNAVSQGVPESIAAKAQELIKNNASSDQVALALGMYAGDYWGTKAKIAQYNKTISAGSGGGVGGVSVGTAPGQSVAQSWLDQYNSGAMELNDIYTKIGSSKDAQKIKNEFAQLVAAQGGKRVLTMDDAQVAAIDEQIKNINDLIGGSGYNYKVISGLSQGGALGIGGRITGAKGDALAIARNLVSNQTLQSLADAKAKGVTFGALSEAELNAVANAASRIASKVIKDEAGQITGFSGSESGFKKDLEAVKTGLEKSKLKKTGSNLDSKINTAVQILNQPTEELGGYNFPTN